MKEQRIQVNGRTRIDVELEDDSTTLDDIVVIGYGAVKKRDLTGAVTSVKAETITMTPTSNPMEALQGRVAGLDITRENGNAGEGVKMQLRGNRSFEADGNPTFIIDGMPGDYATLNPNDIASIEVLKDASSTAIYGSAGANGVVLITTKQGEAGKVNVNLNAYVGVNGWATMPAVLQGEAYMENRRNSWRAVGAYTDDEAMFSSNPAFYEAYKAGKTIDWVGELLKHNGLTQNYSLSVSGGNEKTKAYMSANFSDEQGQYDNDNNKIYSTNIRVDHNIKKWLSIGVNMQASYQQRNRAAFNLSDAMKIEPYGDLYDAEGNVNPWVVENENKRPNFLLNNSDNYRDWRQNTRLYINPYIRITPVKGLTIESRLNTSLVYQRTSQFYGIGSYDYYRGSSSGDDKWKSDTQASIAQNNYYNYKWENIFTYNFTVADDHDFTLTAVTTWNHNQHDVTSITGKGIEDNKYLWNNIENAQTREASSGYVMSKGMGIVGRLNYSYKGKYLFSASFRTDGSSRLGEGHKWATFPAVSVGWRISDEKFMNGTRDWLDNLKVRLSYGETGTAAISEYSTTPGVIAGQFVLGDQLFNPFFVRGIFDANNNALIPNPSLTWERSKSWNIGLDATFLNGRIDFTADVFVTNTDGVIWRKKVPVTSGGYNGTTPYYTNLNLAQTRSKGVELALNTRNIETKNFRWTSAVTFAYTTDKVTGLNVDNGQVTNGDYVYEVGSAVKSFYSWKSLGVWQVEEADEAAIFNSQPGYLKVDVPGMVRHNDNGDIYYTKVNADGVEIRYDANNKYSVSGTDKQALGHNSPDWTLGFQNSLYWKNFDLSIYMYMRWGQTINYTLITEYDPAAVNNYPAHFVGWTAENRSNDFPALDKNVTNKLNTYLGFDGLRFVDGSFFKIKNITLGYTLPKKICSKWGIQNLRIYGTINNPLVVAKHHLLKDYDPEMNGNLNYPLTKQLVFGVNFSF